MPASSSLSAGTQNFICTAKAATGIVANVIGSIKVFFEAFTVEHRLTQYNINEFFITTLRTPPFVKSILPKVVFVDAATYFVYFIHRD